MDEAGLALREALALGCDPADASVARCRAMVLAGDAARKLRAAIRGHVESRLLGPLLGAVGEARTLAAASCVRRPGLADAGTSCSPCVAGLLADAAAEGESMARRLQAERDGLEQAKAASTSSDARWAVVRLEREADARAPGCWRRRWPT